MIAVACERTLESLEFAVVDYGGTDGLMEYNDSATVYCRSGFCFTEINSTMTDVTCEISRTDATTGVWQEVPGCDGMQSINIVCLGCMLMFMYKYYYYFDTL